MILRANLKTIGQPMDLMGLMGLMELEEPEELVEPEDPVEEGLPSFR